LQLELLERIRAEFPRIWNDVLSELQREYGEGCPELFDPVETFSWVGILVPPWKDARSDEELKTTIEPTIQNFIWDIGLDHSAIPDCSGVEVKCKGLELLFAILHW
jgi:hypothetical protein